MFCCVFPEPGELGPRKPQGPDEHAQLLTVRVKPISLTWVNWKERAGCQPQVTAQQAVPRDTCVPWRSQAITFSASPASSQGSAEPQVHGFGCLTPAWAGQEGKGEITEKITIIHSPRTTLVSSVLFCSTVLIWVNDAHTGEGIRGAAGATGPICLLPFKRTATSKKSACSIF